MLMVICSNCGQPLPEKARFCGHCGHARSEIETDDEPRSEKPEQPVTVIPPASDMPGGNTTPDTCTTASFSPDVVASDENASGDALRMQGLPPTLSPGDVRKAELASQRAAVSAYLLHVIPYVDVKYRDQNRALFEKNASDPPPLEEDSWTSIAFIAGRYGHLPWSHALLTELKLGLWQALVWAVRFEYTFPLRQKFVAERFYQLAEFLRGTAADAAFQLYALDSVHSLLIELDRNTLKKGRDDIAKLLPAPPIVALTQNLERYADCAEVKPVLSSIERLWEFLDSRKEAKNQETLALVRQGTITPQVMQRLATMGIIICSSVVYRSIHNDLESRLSDEQLQAMLVLADFATRYSTGDYPAKAQKYSFLLRAIQTMRSGRYEPAAIVLELTEKFNSKKNVGAGSAPALGSGRDGSTTSSDLVALVTRHLAEQRDLGHSAPVEARKWARVFAGLHGLSESDRALFEMEARLHGVEEKEFKEPEIELSSVGQPPRVAIKPESGPLGFLTQEQRVQLLNSIRNARLSHVKELLHDARARILTAIATVLFDNAFEEILPPRRSLHIRSTNGIDPFTDAKTRLMSPIHNDQLKALQSFALAVREITNRDDVDIAREWLVFAQARVNGLLKALPAWEENYRKGSASWEEIWNLAVVYFCSMKDAIQALEMLVPGVSSRASPLSHLRFALYCAVQVLEQAEQHSKEASNRAAAFLVEHLTKLPLPECYLAWLLLVNETQSVMDNKRQLQVLTTFQDVLERPISILRSDNQGEEASIAEFEQNLNDLLHIIHTLEEHYVLEPQENRLGIRSELVATFLRTPPVALKRVGIFVDYENTPSILVQRKGPEAVAQALMRHAARFGEVVCSWVCVTPRNIPDVAGMSLSFEAVGFRVRYPRGMTGVLTPKDNSADFVLLERITHENAQSKPDMYMIVSGDRDYFEIIMNLLEQGKAVRLVASRSERHLSGAYKRLEEKSMKGELPETCGKFFIDNLDEILNAVAVLSPRSEI